MLHREIGMVNVENLPTGGHRNCNNLIDIHAANPLFQAADAKPHRGWAA